MSNMCFSVNTLSTDMSRLYMYLSFISFPIYIIFCIYTSHEHQPSEIFELFISELEIKKFHVNIFI